MKPCPLCAEEIQDAAIICRFCQREVPGEGRSSNASAAPADAHQQFLERGPAEDYQAAKVAAYGAAGGCAQLIGYVLVAILLLWVFGVMVSAFGASSSSTEDHSDVGGLSRRLASTLQAMGAPNAVASGLGRLKPDWSERQPFPGDASHVGLHQRPADVLIIDFLKTGVTATDVRHALKEERCSEKD